MAEVGEPEPAANVKSWPVPLSAIVWGMPGALSLKERLPDAVPAAVGVNVTATVQDPDALTELEVEHVVPDATVAKGPTTLIAVKVRLALPVLVSVTVCEGLVVPTGSDGKVGGADKLTTGPVPVPLKLAVCRLPLALSVKLSEALRLPVTDGVNVTLTVQVLLGVIVAPVQVSALLAKSLAFVPLIVTVEMVRLALPVLVSVTVCDGLVVPTGSDGKTGDADKLTAGAVPVPIKLTTCGLPLALSVSVRLPERAPAAVGVNARSITQLLLVATGALIVQVVPLAATEKSPVATILVKLRDAVPLLVTVTGVGALVVPTG